VESLIKAIDEAKKLFKQTTVWSYGAVAHEQREQQEVHDYLLKTKAR